MNIREAFQKSLQTGKIVVNTREPYIGYLVLPSDEEEEFGLQVFTLLADGKVANHVHHTVSVEAIMFGEFEVVEDFGGTGIELQEGSIGY